jgi:hypothetical protein
MHMRFYRCRSRSAIQCLCDFPSTGFFSRSKPWSRRRHQLPRHERLPIHRAMKRRFWAMARAWARLYAPRGPRSQVAEPQNVLRCARAAIAPVESVQPEHAVDLSRHTKILALYGEVASEKQANSAEIPNGRFASWLRDNPFSALAEFEQPFGCFAWNLPSLRAFVHREKQIPRRFSPRSLSARLT